ncbi:LPXTG cell wall anchor domain-containing protein [Listeria ivanovii]|uniref:LPXTG cell wall anchor domain-containing protein n=1 Tax=Listeria ivanovii TaxID=1638 RepID=UPI00209C0A8A|nr:LPXTG cell wall anchor domain-containing protein [Listeria ivanovii]
MTVVSYLPLTAVNAEDTSSLSEEVTQINEEQTNVEDFKEVSIENVEEEKLETETPEEKTIVENSKVPEEEATAAKTEPTKPALKSKTTQTTNKTYNDWFPDNALAIIVAKTLGDNSDEVVSEERLAQLTFLECYSSGIKDMTGIEYLTGMVTLNCNSNQITNLDISKNVKLKTLYCDQNQLTSIDFSKNLELEILDCAQNQLTSIDVSKNLKLETLYGQVNQLTNLDISKNLELRTVYCNNNELTNLDVSKNLKLLTLDCRYNELTDLDFVANKFLRVIACAENQLTNLDVSKNLELVFLECYNNQLTSLDVSKNLKLFQLSCESNQLTSLDLPSNGVLSSLYCSNNGLKDISNLPKSISRYSALNQTIKENVQILDNGTIVYAIPKDLLDKMGNPVQTITPGNGGVYDAVTRTISWENLPSKGEVNYTSTSSDAKFTATITIPFRDPISITSDDKISYAAGTVKTEAEFLKDIHASIIPASETVISNFTDAVDLTTPGEYKVNLWVGQGDKEDIIKEVAVNITDTSIIVNPTEPVNPIDPVNPVNPDTPINPANIDDKFDLIINQTDSTDSTEVRTKSLPKTGDAPLVESLVVGFIFLNSSLFYLIKRKKRTV